MTLSIINTILIGMIIGLEIAIKILRYYRKNRQQKLKEGEFRIEKESE